MSDLDDIDELNERISNNPKKDDTNNISKTSNDVPEEATEGQEGFGSSNIGKSSMWAVSGHLYAPCDEAIDELPAGQYTVDCNPNVGVHFSRHPVNLDELLILPDSASEEIIDGIEEFWDKEQRFREFGFMWKRGVLLFGPAGSGKTSTLQILSQRIIERDGIAVYVTKPSLTAKGLELLRRIEPERPIVVMVEDIDAIVRQYGESDVLAMLDGELQIDNVVFVATTNYPEHLDKRLVNRPSRFDVVRKIGMPSAEAREKYLTAKNHRLADPQNVDELNYWVQQTKEFSVAHLKELIISVEVFDHTVDQAAKRLRKMMDHHPTSEENEEPFGFLGSDNDSQGNSC